MSKRDRERDCHANVKKKKKKKNDGRIFGEFVDWVSFDLLELWVSILT